jgi:hypothetical protein
VHDPGAQAGLALRAGMSEVIADYPAVRRRDSVGEAWAWVERVAELWRRGAEMSRLEMLGEQFLPGEAIELLAALDSSLVMFGLGDERRHELALDDDELIGRTVGIGAEMWANWDRMMDLFWRDQLRLAGRPDADRPDDWPPVSRPLKRPRRSRRATLQIAEQLNADAAAAVKLYSELRPDGRRQTGAERQAALERVRAVAAISRAIDRERASFSRDDWEATSMLLNDARSVARSLVLATSDDPDRRALAMPLNEVRQRAFMLCERISGASWQEALDALHAFLRANAEAGAESSTDGGDDLLRSRPGRQPGGPGTQATSQS